MPNGLRTTARLKRRELCITEPLHFFLSEGFFFDKICCINEACRPDIHLAYAVFEEANENVPRARQIYENLVSTRTLYTLLHVYMFICL